MGSCIFSNPKNATAAITIFLFVSSILKNKIALGRFVKMAVYHEHKIFVKTALKLNLKKFI
jgi:hypothetical protein